ncbi:MAG: DUF885 domain-containing protein [bacterium]|nr:MAG: DUF885 domain-containing protein [bacterium]
MKFYYLIFSLIFLSLSCNIFDRENSKFEKLANNYIEKMLVLNPEWATSLGDHRYDSLLDDYSLEGIRKNRELNRVYLDSLNTLDFSLLNQENRIDAQILRSRLKYSVFSADTLRSYEWNPMVYNIGGAIYNLLARDFAPLEDRLLSVRDRLKGIPAVLRQAEKNLQNPPVVHVETAIIQNKGNISLIEKDLTLFIEKTPELKEEITPLQREAINALNQYGEWLKRELLPKSTGDFRLGEEKYRKKLRYTLDSDRSKEEILSQAEMDLVKTQDEMYQTAVTLYRQYFPKVEDENLLNDKKKIIKAVLDKLAEDHPTNETIVDLAKEAMQSCTDFVQSEQLVSVPDDPLEIIVMPEFQRGVAVAYCDSPGPLEEEGKTFYAISPTPQDWSQDRVQSFFREYNNYMLQNLTVHEAMPGHYLQLAHSNRFKAPTKVRAIFYSGPFVEGWATYSEQVMVETGYGGPEMKMQQLKMRLRLLINAIIDQKIHTEGMTEEEAMALMMNEGFQEEGEAAGKWRRACLTSAQLSTYYVGNMEVNNLRKAYEAKMGGAFDIQTMHDLMLSFGSPPPKYVKELMGL